MAMQARCRHCNRPYRLKNEEVHAALDQFQSEGMKYYNSYCTHCGKQNRHSKKELKRFAPTWKPTPKKEGKAKVKKEAKQESEKESKA